MSFGPFSALYFVFYEKFKALALGLQDDAQAELPFLAFAAWCVATSRWDETVAVADALHVPNSGAAAGAAASFCTNPLDVVKLRLQVQRSGATEAAGTLADSHDPTHLPYSPLNAVARSLPLPQHAPRNARACSERRN